MKSGLWRYCPKSMWKEPTKTDVEAKKAAEAEKAKAAKAEAEERKARKKQAEKEIIEKVKKAK